MNVGGDEVVSSFKAQFVDRGRAGRWVRPKLPVREQRHFVTSTITFEHPQHNWSPTHANDAFYRTNVAATSRQTESRRR